ncbi:hypothetical protein SAMN06295998_11864 [Primorskyibacter flagellatus]|uniref:Uncharacterized protein n=1 Tax=Primorskyibacter flagellatus TaxID=1387277 RepID=A0A1W2DVJ2_9RHOB|nr:hypothetical protein SAMN06295998_11864 [Primorskyibacter flagellatus]
MLFQPFRDFEGLPQPLRAKAFDRMKRKFDVMQEMGRDLVLVCSSAHPKALGGIDRAAADLPNWATTQQRGFCASASPAIIVAQIPLSLQPFQRL